MTIESACTLGCRSLRRARAGRAGAVHLDIGSACQRSHQHRTFGTTEGSTVGAHELRQGRVPPKDGIPRIAVFFHPIRSTATAHYLVWAEWRWPCTVKPRRRAYPRVEKYSGAAVPGLRCVPSWPPSFRTRRHAWGEHEPILAGPAEDLGSDGLCEWW